MKIKLPNIQFNRTGMLLLLALAVMVANFIILYRRPDNTQAAAAETKPVKIKLTVISAPNCKDCFNTEAVTSALKSNTQLKITAENNFKYTDDQAAKILKEFAIDKAPVVLLDGKVNELVAAVPFVGSSGRKLTDTLFILDKLPPPYVEVATGATRGLFEVTYLTDSNCKECYDAPSVHSRALAGLGMKPYKETTLNRDTSEARAFIRKYAIDSLPTIIVSGDLAVYPAFLQVWPPVGSTEEDGSYVFRTKGQKVVGNYLDLKTSKLVKIASDPAPAAAPSANDEDMSEHHQ